MQKNMAESMCGFKLDLALELSGMLEQPGCGKIHLLVDWCELEVLQVTIPLRRASSLFHICSGGNLHFDKQPVTQKK